MKRRYIPTSSLNFNNIFSTYSISPKSFYELRGFGYRRFEKVAANPFENLLIAYDALPLFQVEKGKSDEFPIWIEVNEDVIQHSNQDSPANSHFILIDRTVYLLPGKFKVLFKSQEEMQACLSRSKKSIETKIYESNQCCHVFNGSYETYPFSKDLNEVRDYSKPNHEAIHYDQKINKLKGLLYGYQLGKSMESSPEFLYFSNSVKLFLDTYSVTLNKILSSLNSKKSKTKINLNKNGRDDTKRLMDELNKFLLEIEILSESFANQSVSEALCLTQDQVTVLKQTFIPFYKGSVYDEIIKDAEGKRWEGKPILLILRKLYSDLKTKLNITKPEYIDTTQNQLNEDIYEIHNQLEYIRRKTESNDSNDLKTIFTISADKKIENAQIGSSKGESFYFLNIVNILLDELNISKPDDFAEKRVELTTIIGKHLKDKSGFVSSNKDDVPDEIKYLRKLYDSYNSIGYGFKIDNVLTKALVGLGAFFFKPQEEEKMRDLLDNSGISAYRFAYAYWGATYGFAFISKILLEPLMNDENIQQQINHLLFKEEKPTFSPLRENNQLEEGQAEGNYPKESQVEDNQVEENRSESNIKDEYQVEANTSQGKVAEDYQRAENRSESNQSAGPIVEVDPSKDKEAEDDPGEFSPLENKAALFTDNIDIDSLFSKLLNQSEIAQNSDWINCSRMAFQDLGFHKDNENAFRNKLEKRKKEAKVKGFGPKKMDIVVDIFKKAMNNGR